MLAAQAKFEAGSYENVIEMLESIENIYADFLLAEKDILKARSHIKLLTHENRKKAKSLLTSWQNELIDEPEIWGRLMMYRVVAEVFLSDEGGAKEVERLLYKTLAKRIYFDATSLRTLNHLRLKANMIWVWLFFVRPFFWSRHREFARSFVSQTTIFRVSMDGLKA